MSDFFSTEPVEEPIPSRRLAHRPLHRKRRSKRPLVLLGIVVVVAFVLIVHFAFGGNPPKKTADTSSSTTPSTLVTSTTSGGTSTTVPASSTTTSATTTTTLPTTTTTTEPAVVAEPPDQVLVEVLNGSGGANAATLAANALKDVGFHINGTGDEASFDYTESVISYQPGNEAYAESVAEHIVGASRLVADSTIPLPDEVDLIVGSDYGGVK